MSEEGFFSNIKDPQELIELRVRLRDIRMKQKKGKELSGVDETYLRENLLGLRKGNFRDDKHRDELLDQALSELTVLRKKFKTK